MNSLLSFIFVVLLVVGLHEGGHYLAGKWLGFKILRFSIGMGPVLWRKTVGETEYCLSALPLGGYVRFFDENDPTYEGASDVEKARAFENQSRVKQAIVLSAGVLVNFLTAWVCFVLAFQFVNLVPSATTATPLPDSPLAVMGAQEGDTITRLNGERVAHFGSLLEGLQKHSNQALTLEVTTSTGDVKTFTTPFEKAAWMPADIGFVLLSHGIKVEKVLTDGPAARAGFKAGDKVLGVNHLSTLDYEAFTKTLQTWHDEKPGQTIAIDIDRAGVLTTLYPTPNAEGKIGVMLRPDYEMVAYQPSWWESMDLGWKLFKRASHEQFVGLAQFVFGNRDKNHAAELVGPVRLAQAAGQASDAGLRVFLIFIGMISVAIGWLNLIPIPVLDGGRLVILGVEGMMRRRLPASWRHGLFAIGAALLLGLMIYAVGLDVKSLVWGK